MWQWVLGKLEGVSTAGNLHSAHTITEKRAIKGPDAMGCAESILPWCEWQYCLWNAVRHGSKMARGALFRNRVTFKVYSFHLATTRALWCWSSHVWELPCACEQHCSLTWGSVWNPLEGVKCSGSIELLSVPGPPTAWPPFLASGTSTKKKKLVQEKWLSVGQWGLRLVSFQYLTPFILQAEHTTW